MKTFFKLAILLFCFCQITFSCTLQENVLSLTQKQQLTWVHNIYRLKLVWGDIANQTTGSNLQEIVWNNELAAKAQEYANTCPSQVQEEAQRTTTSFTNFGQNYYEFIGSSYTIMDVKYSIYKFYLENVNFQSANINPFVGNDNYKQYTQIMWANTNKVGCGYSKYTYNSTNVKMVLICNYYPKGNTNGQAMYSAGTQCTNCAPKTCSTNYKGLCAVSEVSPFNVSYLTFDSSSFLSFSVRNSISVVPQTVAITSFMGGEILYTTLLVLIICLMIVL